MTSGIRWSDEQAASATTTARLQSAPCAVRGCCRPATSATAYRAPRTPLRAIPALQREQIGEQSIRSRDAGGQLSEKAQPRVDVRAFSDRRHEQAPRERRLPRGVRLARRGTRPNPVPGAAQPPPPPPIPPVGP